MKKRILAFLVGGVIAAGATAGLTACGDKGLTVWAPSTQQALVKELVADFLKENPDFGYEINVGVCGENDAYAQLSKDVKASADVYGFANDQLMNLYKAAGLARLSNASVEKIKAENDPKSVEAGKIASASKGDGYYAYPYAADNGFFMYYDSRVVSEEQAKTVEGVLQACADAGKYFLMNMNDQPSWYLGSFFYACGGDYTTDWEEATLMDAKCNFDQKVEGTDYTIAQVGGKALVDLRANKRFVHATDKEISTYATGNRIGAVITGTWNANLLQENLGEGYAATKLPTYHSSLTDEDYQLVPFIGYKLMGVNSMSKHLAEAHQLAAYLTSEKAQAKRFELGIGPSNKVVAATDAVKNNVALSALQSQLGFAKVQESLPGNYWSAFDAFGADVYNGATYDDLIGENGKLAKLISGLNNG